MKFFKVLFTSAMILMAQGNDDGEKAEESYGDEANDVKTAASGYGERLAESQAAYMFNSFSASGPNFGKSTEESMNSGSYSSGINAILNSDGFLNQMEKQTVDSRYSPNGPVEIPAIHTKKTVEVVPVHFDQAEKGDPQVIEISPYEIPLSIVFKTQTNKLNVNQEHKHTQADDAQETNTEEEPQRLVHNVYRPVIQEVTEVIQPYRKLLQKVEPVIEEMKTLITKAAPPGVDAEVLNARNGVSSGGGGGGGNGNSGSNSGFSNSNYARNEINSGITIHKSGSDNGFVRTASSAFGVANPIAYGSEQVTKLSSPPMSSFSSSSSSSSSARHSEGEMSRRFGVTNGRLNVGQSEQQQQNQQSNSFGNYKPNHPSASVPSGPIKDEDSSENYNGLIETYINRFLDHKKVPSTPKPFNAKQNYINLKNRHSAAASNSVSSKSSAPGNYNHKSFNSFGNSNQNYNNNNGNNNNGNNNNGNNNNGNNNNGNNNNGHYNNNNNQNNQQNNGNNNNKDQKQPKFKIIKEFRVTLDDLKKMKLTPFMLKNGVKMNGNAVLAMPQGALEQMTGNNNIFNMLQAASSNTSTRRIGVARPHAKARKLGSFNRNNHYNAHNSNSNQHQFARRSGPLPTKRNMVTIGQESRYMPVRILAIDNKFNLHRSAVQ